MHLRTRRLGTAALAVVLGALSAMVVTQSVEAKPPAVKPPPVSNVLAEPAIKPGSVDSAPGKILGPTQQLKVDQLTGKIATTNSASLQSLGNYSAVDFSTVYNYCYGNLVYTSVHNTTASTQYFEVVLYANGQSRTFYTSVSANGYAYPTWYGTTGAYTAYLYVWNGSSYAYDEYVSNNNTCSVSYSLAKSGYSGYLYVTITNNGTAYPYVEVAELAPYPGSGTYTGTHWYYPAAGGGTASQYVYVGVGQPYGVDIDVAGSTYYASHYVGTY